MSRFIVVAMALLATAGLAHAECTCEGVDNCLGIYFDEGQWAVTCLEDAPANVPVHLYFVLQNSVFETIGGLEFSWRFDNPPTPAPFVLGAVFPPGAVCFADPVNVILGLGLPYPITGPLVVMDLTLLPLTNLVSGLELGPSTPATIPGHAALNDFYNPGNIVPINFPCPVGDDGWTTEPVAQFGNCVTPTESETWGSIKSLYR
jgi:hypothetical protein